MSSIAVFGAGNIGCYVGGRLATAGARVRFIGRSRMADTLVQQGLTLSDLQGWQATLPAEQLRFGSDPAAVADADLVLVTVKSADTAGAAAAIAPHLKPSAVVLSLQNGLHNAEQLAALLPQHAVLTGVVLFNVAQTGGGHFHQGTEGGLAVERSALLEPAVAASERAGLALVQHDDILAVQWAKLLFNLNNAVNALSGLPLKAELSQRAYRRVLAAAQREGIALLRAKQQPLARLTPLPAHWGPALLEMPDTLFRMVASKMLAIDPLARSSMQDDLVGGRRTEIDYLQGEILRLAASLGRPAPVNARLLQLVRAAEQGGRRDWSGEALLAEIRA
ncbi:2-dehydropantoate 2-reductase [Pseudomonas cavernae]|uniref:2-dehydropantoate 2-reductase n=1 Tax=Pseudomonas cavernae TaxID=2320867 RepID=A0A385YWE2_9PSED|nr:2-dehydropantoate 2-reductase [Pseudomonas cavernae]AYC31016.1 2-dehydropantoate 2-reductase [Pseudomonas cavernae]